MLVYSMHARTCPSYAFIPKVVTHCRHLPLHPTAPMSLTCFSIHLLRPFMCGESFRISLTLTFLSTEWHLATGICDVTIYLILQTGKLEKSSNAKDGSAVCFFFAGRVQWLCRNPFNYFVCSSMSGLYDGQRVLFVFGFFSGAVPLVPLCWRSSVEEWSEAIRNRNSSQVWCFPRGPHTRQMF